MKRLSRNEMKHVMGGALKCMHCSCKDDSTGGAWTYGTAGEGAGNPCGGGDPIQSSSNCAAISICGTSTNILSCYATNGAC
jgi:hypothetical protein